MGKPRKVKSRKQLFHLKEKLCPVCGGTKDVYKDGKHYRCEFCNGTGKVYTE